MKRKHRKGHITHIRGRALREAAATERIIWDGSKDKWCYVVLPIIDGPCHAEIQENRWEQYVDHRATMVVDLKIAGVEGRPFMRSERHFCIRPEDALLANGTLRQPLTIPIDISPNHSCLWHFAGGIVFPGEMIPQSGRTAFCEYDAKAKRGFVIVACDVYSAPKKIVGSLPALYPTMNQFIGDVKIFKADGYAWLSGNW